MIDAIKKLLILQDRDHRINQLQGELAGIGPQRQALLTRMGSTQSSMEAAKNTLRLIETERKKAELEAQLKAQAIEKYSLQQFQTKKNEEFRALGHEIEGCKEAIRQLEDRQLEFMEQAEEAQKKLQEVTAAANEVKKAVDSQVADIDKRELNLKKQCEELLAGRNKLTEGIEDSILTRYERLLKHKGEKVVVGIDRGVCGGCHMSVPTQLLVSCQNNDEELVNCSNCGRILYYSSDMEEPLGMDR